MTNGVVMYHTVRIYYFLGMIWRCGFKRSFIFLPIHLFFRYNMICHVAYMVSPHGTRVLAPNHSVIHHKPLMVYRVPIFSTHTFPHLILHPILTSLRLSRTMTCHQTQTSRTLTRWCGSLIKDWGMEAICLMLLFAIVFVVREKKNRCHHCIVAVLCWCVTWKGDACRV